MVWVFSGIAVCVAAVLVLAAAPAENVEMFQIASDALNENAGTQTALSFAFALCVGLWFGRQFGQWAEAGEHNSGAQGEEVGDTIDDLRHLLEHGPSRRRSGFGCGLFSTVCRLRLAFS